MKTINTSDTLFVTVSRMGVELASVRMSGVTSKTEVLNNLRRDVSGLCGLLSVSMRNGSQGWSDRYNVMVAM